MFVPLTGEYELEEITARGPPQHSPTGSIGGGGGGGGGGAAAERNKTKTVTAAACARACVWVGGCERGCARVRERVRERVRGSRQAHGVTTQGVSSRTMNVSASSGYWTLQLRTHL